MNRGSLCITEEPVAGLTLPCAALFARRATALSARFFGSATATIPGFLAAIAGSTVSPSLRDRLCLDALVRLVTRNHFLVDFCLEQFLDIGEQFLLIHADK